MKTLKHVHTNCTKFDDRRDDIHENTEYVHTNSLTKNRERERPALSASANETCFNSILNLRMRPGLTAL